MGKSKKRTRTDENRPLDESTATSKKHKATPPAQQSSTVPLAAFLHLDPSACSKLFFRGRVDMIWAYNPSTQIASVQISSPNTSGGSSSPSKRTHAKVELKGLWAEDAGSVFEECTGGEVELACIGATVKDDVSSKNVGGKKIVFHSGCKGRIWKPGKFEEGEDGKKINWTGVAKAAVQAQKARRQPKDATPAPEASMAAAPGRQAKSHQQDPPTDGAETRRVSVAGDRDGQRRQGQSGGNAGARSEEQILENTTFSAGNYTYTRLIDLQPKARVNVMGIITAVNRPARTAKGDWNATFILLDPSHHMDRNGGRVNLFANNVDGIPRMLVPGGEPDAMPEDSLLIARGLRVGDWNGSLQLIGYKNEFDFACYPVGTSRPQVWRKLLTLGPEEIAWGLKLREWWKRRTNGGGDDDDDVDDDGGDVRMQHLDSSASRQAAGPSRESTGSGRAGPVEVQQKAQAKKSGRRIVTLEELQERQFCDIVVEVIKTYYPSGEPPRVTLYVTDYTTNNLFLDYPYNKSGWTGPSGRYTLQVTLFDEHVAATRNASLEPKSPESRHFVLIRNVLPVMGKGSSGSILEAHVKGDKKHGGSEKASGSKKITKLAPHDPLVTALKERRKRFRIESDKALREHILAIHNKKPPLVLCERKDMRPHEIREVVQHERVNDNFHIKGRVLDIRPVDLTKWVTRHCVYCNEDLDENEDICPCGQARDEEDLQYRWRFSFLIEDQPSPRTGASDDGKKELIVTVTGPDATDFLNLPNLEPRKVRYDPSALAMLRDAITPLLGNLEAWHQKRVADNQREYGPYFDMVVQSYQAEGFDRIMHRLRGTQLNPDARNM